MQEELAGRVPGWRKNPAAVEDEIRSMETLAASAPGTRKAEGAMAQAAFDRHLLQALPDLHLVLPDTTFSGRMALHGSQSADLICLGPAHTAGDCILLLPGARTAFIGDLGFFGTMPFLAWGDPHGWLRALDELLTLPVDTFVPGHGPVGGRGELMLLKGYIEAILSLAKHARTEKLSLAQALELPLPEPYASWPDPWAPLMLEANLARLLA
jgi:glyoxylase-like metal-dependent hydrolase (beta-lactamase superfamily II)